MSVRRWLLSLAVLSFSMTVTAEEARPRDRLLGWSLTPAVGVRILDLDVRRLSDGFTGTITNDGSFFGPMYVGLNIEAPSLMLDDRVGVTVRAHASPFSLDKQRVPSATTGTGSDIEDLGTRVSGYYSYVSPTIFYRTVDATGDTRFGIGYNVWKASYSGEIALASGGAATTATPKTPIEGTLNGKTGAMLFWQARWETGVFEIAIQRVSFSQTGYKNSLQEINMMVGYHYHF